MLSKSGIQQHMTVCWASAGYFFFFFEESLYLVPLLVITSLEVLILSLSVQFIYWEIVGNFYCHTS